MLEESPSCVQNVPRLGSLPFFSESSTCLPCTATSTARSSSIAALARRLHSSACEWSKLHASPRAHASRVPASSLFRFLIAPPDPFAANPAPPSSLSLNPCLALAFGFSAAVAQLLFKSSHRGSDLSHPKSFRRLQPSMIYGTQERRRYRSDNRTARTASFSSKAGASAAAEHAP